MSYPKDELQVLVAALDILVRSEGDAIRQAGIAGLKGGKVILVTRRFKLAVAALERTEGLLAQMADVPVGE